MSKNQKIEIDIVNGFDPITAVTSVTAVTATDIEQNHDSEALAFKNRYSKKFKCPKCGHHPLEIYYFLDWNDRYISDVYVCDICGDFFNKGECDIICMKM